MSTQSPLEYARAHKDEFIERLKALLSIPSISTLPEHAPDMERAAGFLLNRLQEIGITAELVSGDGPPLVYGEWLEAAGAPTVLIYGHYDVQPADPLDLWTTPPFEPTIRDGNIYARGADDDKGQTMTWLNALESLLRTTGRLPINVKIVIEGEEEHGGHVVSEYVRTHGDRLRADFALISDTAMFAPGIPTLDTGLRGMVGALVTARGASHDLHSGLYGGVAPNPLIALAQIIAGLKDTEGRITIPGFYDDVVMPEEDVLRSWRELPFDDETFRREEIGSSVLVGEPGYTQLERMWARPTLDVHGIVGGFMGEGFKTVIPSVAEAKISMRLVPNQRAERVYELFQARVRELTPPGIEISFSAHLGEPVVVPSDSRWVQAAREALQETFGRPAVLARSGGSVPIVGLLKEALGIDTVLMGWGLPDDNLHAPNEKYSLENYALGTEATIRFLEIAGGQSA